MSYLEIRSLEDIRVLMRSAESLLRVKESVVASTEPSSSLGLRYSVLSDWSAKADELRRIEATALLEFPTDNLAGGELLQDLRILQRRFGSSISNLRSEISRVSEKHRPKTIKDCHDSVRSHVSSFIGSEPSRVELFLLDRGSDTAFMERATYTNIGTTTGSIVQNLLVSCTYVRGADHGVYVAVSTIDSVPSISALGSRVSGVTSALTKVASSLSTDSIEIAGRKIVESAPSILQDLRTLSGRSSAWGVARMMSSIGAAGHLRLQSKSSANDVYQKLVNHLRREYGPVAQSTPEISKWVLPGTISRFVKIVVELDGEFVRAEILNLRSL